MSDSDTILKDLYRKKSGSYFSLDRQEMLRYITSSEQSYQILDVGCGSGNFGYLLKTKLKAEVWGVELDKNSASIAAQKLDRVICGAFTDSLNLPVQKFDFIFFNDVLEHMVDPYSVLMYSKKLLRDEGKIIASIPNVRYVKNMWDLLILKDWQYKDLGVLDRTHLRFFTRKSILSTFASLGYSVESIEGINPFYEKPIAGRHILAVAFFLFNWLLLNQIEDMRYLQFVVVASPNAIDKLNQASPVAD